MERYRKHAKSYLETFPKALLQSSSSERSMTSKGWLWEETGGYNHPQPGSGLIQYGMGALADRINPSVIYSTYLKNGVAMPLSPQVAQWLTKAGIRRLIVGHQPNGDAPWIMKEECTDTSGNKQQIQVVCADNAYAKSVQWPSSHFQLHSCYSKAALNNVDSQIPHGYLSVSEFEKLHHLHALGSSPHNITTRGNSVMNEVLIEIQDNKESTLSVRGTLTDGCTYRYTLPAKKHEDHDLIGKKVREESTQCYQL